jgi:hypothetical protein
MPVVSCELISVRDELAQFTRGLTPGEGGRADATSAVALLGEIERLAGAAKALLARWVADTGGWKGGGDRSPAHWLARQSGTSVGEAGATLDAAEKLDGLAATDAAFRAGRLSAPQVREITTAAAVNPHSEGDLLEAAGSESLRELRERARLARAAGEDENTRHLRIKKSRYLRAGVVADGAFELHYRDTPDAGADILAALTPLRDRIFREARTQGRRHPLEAYTADALHRLARTALTHTGESGDGQTTGAGDRVGDPDRHGGGVGDGAANAVAPRNAKIIVRIDHTALTRGHVEPGEICEIAGVGPVPVATVKAMMSDAFIAAVVTKGEAVANVAHLGRKVTAKQRTALEWRGLRCAVAGCPARQFLEIDHLIDWAATHHTKLDELEWLCPHHHDLKTYQGYRLEPGTGPRRLLAPDHPDNPNPHRGPPDRRQRDPAPPSPHGESATLPLGA